MATRVSRRNRGGQESVVAQEFRAAEAEEALPVPLVLHVLLVHSRLGDGDPLLASVAASIGVNERVGVNVALALNALLQAVALESESRNGDRGAFNGSVRVRGSSARRQNVEAGHVEIVRAAGEERLVIAILGSAGVVKESKGIALPERSAATKDNKSDYQQAFQFQRILLEVLSTIVKG